MPIARHIFGRDKPSLTCLVHGGAEPAERRRALGLQQVFIRGAASDILRTSGNPSRATARR
jgi:hypothetical protein